MSGGQEVESEDDWLFDYMMETFRSPTWEVPVMTFIDENCVIFDNDEENKLVYTEKHREFCQLIDNLLSSHLSEIGVSEVQFAKAVEAGYQRRDVNRKVFDQIIAVDDFLTFKKMMVKRNVQLELEVVEAMKNAKRAINAPSSKEEEDNHLKEATKFSEEASRFVGGKTRDSDDGSGAGSKTNDKEATQLKAAMEANLLEMQLYAKQMELEQAELEKALAISLKLEEERLMRLKQLQKEQSDVEKLAKEVEKAELELAEERTREKQRAQRMYEEGERQREEEEERQRKEDEEKARRKAERKARKKEERRAEKRRLKAEAKAQEEQESAMSMSGGLKPLKPLGKIAGSKFDDDDDKTVSKLGSKSLLGPIPDIKAFEKKKAMAMEEFRKNQEEIEKRRAEQEEMQRAANISEQEMEARAEYLRQQRARMLEKKRQERERKLRQYQERKALERNTEKEKFEKAKMQMEAEKSKAEKNDKPKENNKPKELTAAEKKRRQMAMALGMQMKKDMLDDEDQRNNSRQVEQFAALDEQLRQAERMRQERRRQHNAQRDRIRQDKLIRAMNVQSSSFANRIVHGDEDFAFKEQ